MNRLYRWIVPDSCDVFPTHTVPRIKNWFTIMRWIWESDERREKFAASTFAAYDAWKSAKASLNQSHPRPK